MSGIINTISKKIKDKEILVEYGLILAVEASLALIVIHNMVNMILSMLN